MPAPAHPPVVYIEWRDSMSLGGWQSRKEMTSDGAKAYAPLCAAGFLVHQSAKYLILAAGYNPHNDDATQGLMIPAPEVVRMVVLRPARGMPEK